MKSRRRPRRTKNQPTPDTETAVFYVAPKPEAFRRLAAAICADLGADCDTPEVRADVEAFLQAVAALDIARHNQALESLDKPGQSA